MCTETLYDDMKSRQVDYVSPSTYSPNAPYLPYRRYLVDWMSDVGEQCRLHNSTVHVGTIQGGTALNIVPDQTVLDMEFRHLPDVPAEDILEALRQAAGRVEAGFDRPGAVSIEALNSYPGLGPVADPAIIDTAHRLGGDSRTIKVAFGTEAGYFASLGLNTVVMGPGDMSTDGHKPDESLSLDQLGQCDAMMDRVVQMLS